MRSAVFLVGLLAAFLPSCGGASPAEKAAAAAEKADAAQAVFTAGKYAEARTLCEEGLAADTTRSDKALRWRLERIRVESIATSGDKGAEVLATLGRLAGEFADQVDAGFHATIANEINNGGNLLGAIDVVHAGKERFPLMAAAFDGVLKALKKAAQGNDAATEKLRTLGYL